MDVFNNTLENVSTWYSTIQWSCGQMEAWKWNDAWKSSSSFYLPRGLMLLMDVSLCTVPAVHSALRFVCVYKPAFFCHLHFLCKEGKHPKLWPQRALSRWVQELCKVWSHLLLESGTDQAQRTNSHCSGEQDRARRASALSIVNLILALPSADQSQYCNAKHPGPLGSQVRALLQVTNQRLRVILAYA